MYKPTVFIDLDDTLVETSRFYRDTITKGATCIAGRTGLGIEHIEAVIAAVNNALLHQGKPFDNSWFPDAFAGSAGVLAAVVGIDVGATWRDRKWLADVLAIGRSVYDSPFPAMSGAVAALQLLRQRGYQIIVYTKGETALQHRKVMGAGLGLLVDDIEVVGVKDVATLQAALIKHDADFTNSWVVGDSLRDDIAPAVALRLPTVLVAAPDVPGNAVYDNSGRYVSPTQRVIGPLEAVHFIPDRGAAKAA